MDRKPQPAVAASRPSAARASTPAALADDRLLPRDEDGPVFAEAWEARAFALVWKLADSGQFEWAEWVKCLSRAIAEDASRPYYQSWLIAAEQLITANGLISRDRLLERAAELSALPTGHDHQHKHEHGHEH